MNDPLESGPEFDSPEELHLSWWLDELKEAGYVDSWRRPDSVSLVRESSVQFIHRRYSKKTGAELKPEIRKKTLRSELSYTPDFEVEWSFCALGLFCFDYQPDSNGVLKWDPGHRLVAHSVTGSISSLLEVKPKIIGRTSTNTARFATARMLSALLFETKGIFTNLVLVGSDPKSIFDQTFTPRRFLLTDKTEKPRKIHFETRTLAEFVSSTPKLRYATHL